MRSGCGYSCIRNAVVALKVSLRKKLAMEMFFDLGKLKSGLG